MWRVRYARTTTGRRGGKSTALRCAAGLETPDAGTVRVDGRPAMVFQQIHLVKRRSAIDNVCAGALGRLPLRHSLTPALYPRELREEAMTCLDRVGLADRAAERAGRLSGGQQRVAIARALCQRATVVLAAVVPQFVGLLLYRFDVNVRASLVLGLVGAGGIGFLINQSIKLFRFDEMATHILVVLVLVVAVDQLSASVRRRLAASA
ncbi:ATP-binding cassette domain-containing protein [Acrocarpospora phusangensis]|uniref:ATP-binding cassette domain-containing protein n=1 Tax=Acrocarpospora phusangensis TaxID=1070424 RepID=UPI0019522B61|nr:ATP-binding cassette domain-containing protein [Acrocarpospora phusangensis]